MSYERFSRLSIVDEVTCPHRIRNPYIDKCDIDEWDEIREEWEQEDDRR